MIFGKYKYSAGYHAVASPDMSMFGHGHFTISYHLYCKDFHRKKPARWAMKCTRFQWVAGNFLYWYKDDACWEIIVNKQIWLTQFRMSSSFVGTPPAPYNVTLLEVFPDGATVDWSLHSSHITRLELFFITVHSPISGDVHITYQIQVSLNISII